MNAVMLIGIAEYEGSLDEYGCYRNVGVYYPPIKEYYVCKGRKVIKRLFPLGKDRNVTFLAESAISVPLPKSVGALKLSDDRNKRVKKVSEKEKSIFIKVK